MNYWLIKSEPDVFSFADLLKAPRQTCAWEGVRNYQARNYMRDEMKLGEKILFYHSSTAIPAVAGIAEVASLPYPDPSQFDPKSPFFDPRASPQNPRWLLVDVRAVQALPRLVSLAEIKANPNLKQLRLVQKGNRLSVMPIGKKAFETILALAYSPDQTSA